MSIYLDIYSKDKFVQHDTSRKYLELIYLLTSYTIIVLHLALPKYVYNNGQSHHYSLHILTIVHWLLCWILEVYFEK